MILNTKITFKKITNAVKLYLSYYVAGITKLPVRWGYPVSLSVEPITGCNLSCPECPIGAGTLKRKAGKIDIDLYKKTIDEFAPYLLNLILYFQGEPFLHPQFCDLIKHASLQKKIYTTTSTNGHFLDKEKAKNIINSGLNKLIISIDGTTQEVYEKYRTGGDLNTVIENMKILTELKKQLNSKTPEIVIQFLVLGTNEHQINDIKKLTKEISADKLKLKSAQIYDFKNGNPFIPRNKKYSRYKKNAAGFYDIKNKMKNHCLRLWNSAVVTWDGDILPCCFDKDAKYIFGNIRVADYKSIKNNKKYKDFLSAVLKNRKAIDICQNCTEGLKL